jgi:hypothetical protein
VGRRDADIGLAFCVRGGQKNAGLRLDKACEIGPDPGLQGVSFFHAPIGGAEALPQPKRTKTRNINFLPNAAIGESKVRLSLS